MIDDDADADEDDDDADDDDDDDDDNDYDCYDAAADAGADDTASDNMYFGSGSERKLHRCLRDKVEDQKQGDGLMIGLNYPEHGNCNVLSPSKTHRDKTALSETLHKRVHVFVKYHDERLVRPDSSKCHMYSPFILQVRLVPTSCAKQIFGQMLPRTIKKSATCGRTCCRPPQ